MAKDLKTNYDHGSIHLASEQIVRQESKSAGDIFRDVLKFPWLSKCVHFLVKKLMKLFPEETPESEVSLPFPKKMPAESAAGLILHKDIPVDTYRAMKKAATCKETGFTVGLNYIKVVGQYPIRLSTYRR